MSYNSKYTGEQVEQLLDQVANGETGGGEGGGGGITIETDPVFSASPAASITEEQKSEWDSKYSKPSGGIPASDLASDVQTSLGKADTAIQSTSFGELTDLALVKGFESARGGTIYALPDAANGDEDDVLLSRGTVVKTINGQTIMRDGDNNDIITTYKRITTNLSSVELLPNSVTEWAGPVLSQELVLTFGEQPPQGYAVEYIAKFNVGADDVQLIVPDNVVWADGVYPAMTNGKTYEISFVDNLATFLEF